MAILVSAGVDVQIIDESFYGSAGAGTVPLIVIATASNKTSPSGTGIAPYTVPDMAGKLVLTTSQRDLIQSFGSPIFKMAGGTPLHGHELNEYGLHAAYSYHGVSNRAYIMRADIDLAQLESSDSAPKGDPISGTHWHDTAETEWGVFQSNGNSSAGLAWEPQTVVVATSANMADTGFGENGDFAVVPSVTNFIYEKVAGAWHQINSTGWKAAHKTTLRGSVNPTIPSNGTLVINGVTATLSGATTLANVISAITSASVPNIAATDSAGALLLTNNAGGVITITAGAVATALGLAVGTVKAIEVKTTNTPQYPAASRAGDVWVKLSAPNRGAAWKVRRYNATTGQWVVLDVPFYAFDYNQAVSNNPAADTAAIAAMGSPIAGTIYAGFDIATGAISLRRWSGTAWAALDYQRSAVAPSSAPAAGTMWFSSDFRADIMVGDGQQWHAYGTAYPTTDPAGPIISGSAPLLQSDGSPLVANDLWINSSDLENYPRIYRYDATALRWKLVNNADQTTPFGIVFADARADSGPAFTGMPNADDYEYNSEVMADMLKSDFLDPDAPDARAYPADMLLFNTRFSTYNVKEWNPEYFAEGNYDANINYSQVGYDVGDDEYQFPALTSTGRWVTVSGNRLDGSPYMGRKAQRVMVVRAMAAAVAASEEARSEAAYFNLIAAPGYPELIDELIVLNKDQREVSFIVADTPARLAPTGTAINAWAKNTNLAASNGEDGLTSNDPYVGLYYPWGLSTNLDGTEIMVPPSSLALRVMAYNDQVSYPWMAPAGYQRGVVDGATSVGFLTAEGEFRSVLLNQGQRDVLYTNKINPFYAEPGRGLITFGQKTLYSLDSSRDRINVARLDNYLRFNLDKLVKAFLYEPNDAQTRDAARITVERFLTGLVALRGLEDFAVVCDESNNTPERRDRNELWIDIAIKPMKAIEFIYIPVRIRNSGDTL
jgi:hypothetical protein